jgi:hypothetical protein
MSTNTDKAARLATLTAELDSAELDAPEPVDDRPIGVRRLEAAREHVADLDTFETSEAASAAPVVKPGDWVHSVDESGVMLPASVGIFGTASVNLLRGDEIQVTEEMAAAARDRHGRPGWLALVHDDDAQIAKWGSVRLRPGRAPHTLAPWTYGSPAWSEARETARREAWGLPTAEARTAALAEVQRVYGAAPTTSTTLNTAQTPTERAAAEQNERIRVAAANGTINTGPSRGGE